MKWLSAVVLLAVSLTAGCSPYSNSTEFTLATHSVTPGFTRDSLRAARFAVAPPVFHSGTAVHPGLITGQDEPGDASLAIAAPTFANNTLMNDITKAFNGRRSRLHIRDARRDGDLTDRLQHLRLEQPFLTAATTGGAQTIKSMQRFEELAAWLRQIGYTHLVVTSIDEFRRGPQAVSVAKEQYTRYKSEVDEDGVTRYWTEYDYEERFTLNRRYPCAARLSIIDLRDPSRCWSGRQRWTTTFSTSTTFEGTTRDVQPLDTDEYTKKRLLESSWLDSDRKALMQTIDDVIRHVAFTCYPEGLATAPRTAGQP